MSGWGCPHEIGGKCMRINGIACDPGMKGCVLFGRFRFSNDGKNRNAKPPRTAIGEEQSRQPEIRQPEDRPPSGAPEPTNPPSP